MLTLRSNINIITASPPTYDNWSNYLAASLQATYNFSSEKSRIKAVLLCNPHNPLGRCYPKKVLLEVMEFCQEHGLHLIVDEIYALLDLNVGGDEGGDGDGQGEFVSALSLTEPLVRSGAVKVDPSRVHVVWSASKVFGMSGFRIVSLSSIFPFPSSFYHSYFVSAFPCKKFRLAPYFEEDNASAFDSTCRKNTNLNTHTGLHPNPTKSSSHPRPRTSNIPPSPSLQPFITNPHAPPHLAPTPHPPLPHLLPPLLILPPPRLPPYQALNRIHPALTRALRICTARQKRELSI